MIEKRDTDREILQGMESRVREIDRELAWMNAYHQALRETAESIEQGFLIGCFISTFVVLFSVGMFIIMIINVPFLRGV